MDNEKVAAETKAYKKIPQILSFTNDNGVDGMKEVIELNYRQVKLDILGIIDRELDRIANDPDLAHLLKKE
ncbi:hypothetical protein D3C87_1031950 [compost metagenome]